jgi:hypothetical protein
VLGEVKKLLPNSKKAATGSVINTTARISTVKCLLALTDLPVISPPAITPAADLACRGVTAGIISGADVV